MKPRLNNREKLNIVNFVEYLFVLILILNARTIWTSFEDSPLSRALKAAVVVVGMLYILVQGSILNKTLRNIFLSLGFGFLYIVLYASAVGYKTTSFVYFVFTVIAVYAFLQVANSRNRGSEIFFKYRDIVLVVAVISLFFWVFGSTLGIIHPTESAYISWGAHNTATGFRSVPSYYGIYFETQEEERTLAFLGITIRNTAIFTEAPMCNFNFCLALLIELFYVPNTSRRRCAIFIVAILTTISTTGYCLLAIALTVKYLTSSGKKRGFVKLLSVVSIPAAIIVAILVANYFFEAKMQTGSGIDRLRDFVVGFQAWANKPVFGYGYGLKLYYGNLHYGFSNSITPILGHGGLFLAAPYLYCMFMWCRSCIKERDFQKFLLFANFIFIFTITIMSYQYLTICFLFAYCMKRKSLRNR